MKRKLGTHKAVCDVCGKSVGLSDAYYLCAECLGMATYFGRFLSTPFLNIPFLRKIILFVFRKKEYWTKMKIRFRPLRWIFRKDWYSLHRFRNPHNFEYNILIRCIDIGFITISFERNIFKRRIKDDACCRD